MGGAILAAALEVETEVADDREAEVPLRTVVVMGLEEGALAFRAATSSAAELTDQWNELFAKASEHGLDARRLHSGLELVEKRIVDPLAVAENLGLLDREPEDLRQVGLETGEIVGLPRFLPGALAERRGAGEAGNQIGRILAARS